MPAYAVFVRESIQDQAEMDVYSSLAGGSLEGHDCRVLAAYGAQEVWEGPQVEGMVIVEFPTLAAAKAWYDGPAYRAAREHRFRGATYRAMIVEGV